MYLNVVRCLSIKLLVHECRRITPEPDRARMEMSKFSARRKQSKRAPLTSESIPDLAIRELNYTYYGRCADPRADCNRQSNRLPFLKVFENLWNILIADVKINPACEIYPNLYRVSQKCMQNNLLKNLNPSVIYISIATLLLLVTERSI